MGKYDAYGKRKRLLANLADDIPCDPADSFMSKIFHSACKTLIPEICIHE